MLVALAGTLAACGGSSGGNSKTHNAELFANALTLQQNGQLTQARDLYAEVLKADPKNYYAHYNLGVIDQQGKQYNSALAEYGAALTAKPGYVPALFNEATIYQLTNPALAISTYRAVTRLQPIASTAYFNLGLLEIKHGQPKQGVRDLKKAVQQNSALLQQVPKHLQGLVGALASGQPTKTPTGTTSPTPTTSSS